MISGMNRVLRPLLVLGLAGLAACAQSGISSGDLTYPATATSDQVDNYFGTSVPDPYRWLEDLDGKQTRDWIERENKLTFRYLKKISGRKKIRARLEELWDYEKFGTPVQKGEAVFFTRNDGLQNQPVLYVQNGEAGAPRVLLDPNSLSDDGTISLAGWSASEDGKYLAYALSEGGSDWQDWYVRDVESGADLDDHIEWTKFTGASWQPDSSGFYYTGYPTPEGDALEELNENATVYFHKLGDAQTNDAVVYKRPEHPRWGFGAGVTDDGKWLVVNGSEGTERKNRVWLREIGSDGPFLDMYTDFDGMYNIAGNKGNTFYIHTTKDAARGKVVAVEFGPDGIVSQREIIAENDDVLSGLAYLNHSLVAMRLHNAHTQISVHDLDGNPLYELELPTLGSVRGVSGKWDQAEAYYSFSSFTFPTTIYKLDLASGKSEVFRQPKVDFNPDDFKVEQVWYTSKDGTKVPMFLVRGKDVQPDFTNPTMLYGYGGFNISLTPSFSPANLVWLEMGGVYAMPNLRGGGEFGQAWHQAGTIHNKQNVFDDFIAAAEWLIDEGWTRKDKLAIRGGSNGGLLVGACLTQRPDLFAATLPAVGVMDMLRYHKFTIGWAWASDYGTSDDPEQFKTLHAYSPVHNVQIGRHYPATLITTGDHDDRVVPGHSYKFAAALQRGQGGEAPILIRIETRGGHGGGKPTGMILDSYADQWAFLVKNLNMNLDAF
jgi:prolyl oligopeptidase